MRKDALGLFWRDEPVIKVTKEQIKRTPPEPVWLKDDYLPGLEEALAFNVPLMTDAELVAAQRAQHRLIFDIECYANYFLVAFKDVVTKKIVYVDATETQAPDLKKLAWIIQNFTIVGFNSWSYDLVILALALAGKPLALLKAVSTRIIMGAEGDSPNELLRAFRVKRPKCDHIDLIEIAPLRGSLKIYSARIHARKLQDLPFHPDRELSPEQIAITRLYCVNDLDNTEDMYFCLEEQIKLRETLTAQYHVDVRSKSDAQIAETVFSQEVSALNGSRASKPIIAPGTVYRYHAPAYMRFSSNLLQYAFEMVKRAKFIVEFHGAVGMPSELGELKLDINGTVYQMGIGGLHSKEKKAAYRSIDGWTLHDFDVTSFYPKIILNQGLYPYHLGPNFLRVYRNAFDTRVAAKHAGNAVVANGFKIVLNGSFGKLGSKYSNLYAPDLLIQVTLSGQLSLLMLIERLELAGIHVVSANTDGIVIRCHDGKQAEMRAIVESWEKETEFNMEETQYLAIFSRDVNSYIAVKRKFDKSTRQWGDEPAGCKLKGAYANPWKDHADRSMWMHKNPVNTICIEAVAQFLQFGTPLAHTITTCSDIRKFVSVRSVTGGAVKDGVYLGKSIRWYYAVEQEGEIVYAKTGNKVPRSDGARPLMVLPTSCPADVDHDWYIAEAEKILKQIGY